MARRITNKKQSNVVDAETGAAFKKAAKEMTVVGLAQEVANSFLEYSYSVIYSRAIPDARDGLKPVHRRVLYSMFESGYTPEKPFVKSAKVVGNVMGTYHPHGDCLAGDTLILTEDGSLLSLEDLAGEYKSEVKVACVDKYGRLTTSRAHSFRIGQWADKIYHITLASGLKVEATANHPFLSAANEWLKAEELEFGSVLRGAFYDPSKKTPTLSMDEVVHIHIENLNEKVPMYDFTVDSHENLFVAKETTKGISLIVAHNSAIYDSMARMVQDFTMRVPLVDGHGAFGSSPEDSPASARYTESRLSREGLALIGEIKEDGVDFVPNFDGSTTQPSVLAATYPNLLINGSSGIAVGMATNMAPHNPDEVLDACRWLLTHPNATLEKLMEFVPGPDFPSGGLIINVDQIKESYLTGKGIIKIRAKITVEPMGAGKHRLVVSEFPYQVGPEKILSMIKEGLSNKRLQGITRAIDLSDRKKSTNLIIELKSGFNPQTVINALYKYTPLEVSFGMQNLALIEGQPKYLGLQEMLQVFIDHRISIVLRRSMNRQQKKTARSHLVEGILRVLLDIDKAIAIIRKSEDTASAKTKLKTTFKLDDIQAEYVLSLQLRRLTRYDTEELDAENKRLTEEIAALNKLINSDAEIRKVVAKELEDIKKLISSPRRSLLTDVSSSDKAPNVSFETASSNASAGSSASSTTNGVETTLVLTTRGKLEEKAKDSTHKITFTGSFIGITKLGAAHRLHAGDQYPGLIAIVPETDTGVVAIGTKDGIVKLVTPDWPARQDDFTLINLAPKDEIIGAYYVDNMATHELVFITTDSSLLKFPAGKLRPQGRNAGGVAGISLEGDNKVIAFAAISTEHEGLVVTYSGKSVKSTPLKEYPPKGRATKGMRSHRFLKGEDSLQLAVVSLKPLAIASGKVVNLPPIDKRRDGSGTPIALNALYNTVS